MALARAQVIIPMATNLPQDVITNTLYFEGTGDSTDLVAQAENCTPLIQTFYNAVYAPSGSAAQYVSWSQARVQWYDLAQPEPRVPIVMPMPITAVSPSQGSVPSEVAIVASFHAAQIPGGNPRRRRGRIYLGGWSAPALTPNATRGALVATATITAIVNAMESMQTTTAALDNVWSVYSPTSSTVGPLFVPVEGGWVDNAPDTQRRRGVESTARTTWPD